MEKFIIIWFIIGLSISFMRGFWQLMEGNEFFAGFSWAQVIIFLFLIGPFAPIVGFGFVLSFLGRWLVEYLIMYWNKLGEIGKR